jgi:hypothetical protein
MRRAIILMLSTFLGLLAVSCGTTQLTNLWRDPSYNAPPMKKLLVVAFRRDQVNRRMWEDAFVAAIGKQDPAAGAVPSYHLFPNDVPDPDSLGPIVTEQGFEGVLLVSRVERDTLTADVPGYTSQEPVTKYSRRWNTFVTRYQDVYHPGTIDTSMAVSVRTDLLLPKGDEGQMVWSATSQSVNPASRDEFRAGVATTVAKQLRKAGFIH